MPEETTRFYFDAPAQQVETGTARLACRRYGSGPPLLLVHGFPLSGFTWRKILPELSRRYTCYVPDLPGMGDSEWSDATDFSFPGQGHTLKRLVERLELERYSIVAQDTGGTFARFLALEDTARVEKLVLINTEMPGHRPPWIPLYQFLMRLPGTLSVFKQLLGSDVFLRSPMGFGWCFKDPRFIGGDFKEYAVRPLVESPRGREGLRLYLMGAKWDAVEALERERARSIMPVQLVCGAADRCVPVERERGMVRQFPDASLEEIPGARVFGH